MRHIKRLLIALAILTAALATPAAIWAQGYHASQQASLTTAQQDPITFKNPLAYVGEDGNVYITDEFSGAGKAITGDAGGAPNNQFPFIPQKLNYIGLTWSSDGKMLAFLEMSSNKTVTVVESGKAPVVVAKGVDSNYPPAFSPDGKEIAYVVLTPQMGPDGSTQVTQIQAVSSTGGSPRALGSLTLDPAQCGADIRDPGAINYFGELGVLGKSPMYFKWLSGNTYLHSIGCNGQGVGLSNGATDIWQNKDLQNPALSPDGTKLLAVRTQLGDSTGEKNQLNLVDLSTGNLTPIETQVGVDRATFTPDGKFIVYTTAAPARTVKGKEDSALGKQLFTDMFWPTEASENVLMVWVMSVEGGTSTPVFKGAGQGFGYLTSAHNKPFTVFSLSTATTAMLDRINAGDTADNVIKAAPHSEIIFVSTDVPGVPTLIARGGKPAFSPADEFTALPAQVVASVPTLVAPTLLPPPTMVIVQQPTPTFIPTATPAIVLPNGGTCPGFLPSRLVIGQKGQVLPGQSNRVRAAPPSGAILTVMPAGSVFDVLGGPTCTSNGIAWWQIKFNGIVGWTAEGQGNSYWLQPFSGTPPTAIPPANDGSFGIVGVTAAVNPATANGCPSTFNFTGQIVVNKVGVVTWRWEGDNGFVGPTQTWNVQTNAYTLDVALSVNASAGGWRKIHVLTPNDISSNQATFTILCAPAVFAVTGVNASVNPNNSAVCPSDKFTFTGQITSNAAGTVTYRWERSDGAHGPDQTINFGGPGSQTVTTQWQLGAGGTFWEKVHVTSPNDISSNQATFTHSACP
jgi:Tol biopolymer transport system component